MRRVFVGFVSLALIAGCGGGLPQQKTYPVTGTVTLDGKPLPNVTVIFHAENAASFKWKELPQGTTDAEGKFTVFTYTNAPADGAPAGSYKVGIEFTPPPQDDDGNDQVKRVKGVRIPAKYADPKTSGLTATVDAKPNQLSPFALSSKP
jgi:hypothetical protein